MTSRNPLASLPKATRDLVEGQINLAKARKKGERYSLGQKQLAARLFHQSPGCYAQLAKTIKLPTPRTLSRHLNASLGNFDVS